jgi:hypothetical protein
VASPQFRTGIGTNGVAGGATTSPSGTLIGDLVIVVTWERMADGGSVPTHTVDGAGGYVEIKSQPHDDGTTDGRLSIAYKVATADGAQSYQAYTSSDGTDWWTGCVVIQKGTYAVSTLPKSAGVTSTNNTVPNPPQVTGLASAIDYLLFAVAAWRLGSAAALNDVAPSTPAQYTIRSHTTGSNTGGYSACSRAGSGITSEDPGSFGDAVTPTGTSSITFALAGISEADGAAAGAGDAAAAGATVLPTVGSAAGEGAAAADGEDAGGGGTIVEADGLAVGTGDASGAGVALALASAAAAGDGAASGVGAAPSLATGAAAGLAAATADGVVGGVAGFGFYKTHTLAGSADGALTDFQMSVTVHYGAGTDSGSDVYLDGKCQTDFDDVRFTDADGADIDYWRESVVDSDNAVFWFEAPNIPASPDTVDVRIYYGNATAADAGDIRATFLMGDDFESFAPAVLLGTPPTYAVDTCKAANGDIFAPVSNPTSQTVWLYRTQDDGVSWSNLSTIWGASSSRTNCYCDTDGDQRVYVSAKIGTGTGLVMKRSEDAGSTWSTEKTIVASGLSGALDPKLLYVSATLLLCLVRVVSGANFEIRCYSSDDHGDTWSLLSTPHTEASAGLNSLEDTDAIVAANGDILLTWEREVTELSTSSVRQRISDDGGSTWGAESTIVASSSTEDNEGGSYLLSGSTLTFIYGTNVAGTLSYDKAQVYKKTSADHGVTWGEASLIWESYDGVENVGEFTAGGDIVLLQTKGHVSGGEDAKKQAIAAVVGGVDWRNRHWAQDGGLAYVATVGGVVSARVEGHRYNTNLRGFLVQSDFSGQDAIIEARVRSPLSSSANRLLGRYTDENNHYMVEMADASIDKIQVYKRVSGTYTLLNEFAFTSTAGTFYRMRWQISGVNPTTMKVWVDGVLKNNFTEATSTQTTGKAGLSAGTSLNRFAHVCDFIFARKFTATEPTHGAWGDETAVGVIETDGSAAGVGAASGVGVSIVLTSAAASGVGAALADGEDAGAGGTIVEADGLAVGEGVATGVGASLNLASGASVGDSSAAGVGATVWSVLSEAAGLAAAAAVAAALFLGAGASAGEAEVLGAASATVQSDGSAVGVADAQGVGAAVWASSAEAAGIGAAAGVSSTTAQSSAAAAGDSTASAVGSATAQASASASGVSDVSGQGEDAAEVGSEGLAAGLGGASGVGAAAALSEASSVGVGAAQADASAVFVSSGSASGTADAQAIASATAEASGSAAGSSTAAANASAIAEASGVSAGSSTAAASSSATAETAGSSAGASSAQADGEDAASPAVEADANASGASSAQADASAVSAAAGSSAGVSAAQADGEDAGAAVVVEADAAAAGASSAAGVGGKTAAVVGVAAGSSSATARTDAPAVGKRVTVQLTVSAGGAVALTASSGGTIQLEAT